MTMQDTNMLHNLILYLQDITKILSKTVLTSDVIKEVCKIITCDVMKEICTIWINDPDTTIGMECLWQDMLINRLNICSSLSEIEEALDITLDKDYKCIEVKHEKYGKQNVYITVLNDNIIMSTKLNILYDYCTGNTDHW